jgi:succinate dehydrogenase flavin-adding protein (antitoxin of CptAB toxin-antitoxin module)
MSQYNIKKLKKQIIYRCSYTGTKETDLLYQKLIVNKIDSLAPNELFQLSNLFNEVSDADIFLILNNKINSNNKYTNLFKKLME